MPQRSALRATALVVFSACCFGSIPILITLGIGGGARLIDLLIWRYVLAALMLAALAVGTHSAWPARHRILRILVIAGGGQAAIAFVSLSALRYIPAATLTFLFYTYPAWVAVTAAIRGTEPLTAPRLAALGLSLAGIALMVGMPGTGGLHPVGVLLALSSALLYAMYIPTIGHLGDGIAPTITSSLASGGAAIVLVFAALAQGGLALRFSPVAWMAIVVLAIACTVLAFIAFLRGLAEIGPVRTAIVSTVEPFWTALLASVVLGQAVGPRTMGGGVLIAAAVVVLQLGAVRPARASAVA
ncbi:MAG: DMT family transporter [Gemmatimonadaceae bacterium]|nr:DMT family transporter [Gemmatimonadaceae bacterium]